MNETAVVDLVREGIWVGGLVAGPTLIVVLIVGVIVGIFQAATSINEMTLSFLPKLVAVTIHVMLIGAWQLQLLIDFTRRILERVADVGM